MIELLKEKLWLVALCSLLFVLVGRLYFTHSIVSMSSTAALEDSAVTPYLQRFPSFVSRASVAAVIRPGVFGTSSIHVLADDVAQEIVLNGVRQANRCCGYPAGAALDLFLPPGSTHSLRIGLLNSGGPGQVSLAPSLADIGTLIPLAALFLLFLLFVFDSFYREQPLSLPAYFLLGLLLRFVYLSLTPYWLRHYDYDGHLEVLGILMTQDRYPDIGETWESHQAPLYYYVARFFLSLCQLAGRSVFDVPVDLQTLSFVLETSSFAIVLYTIRSLGAQPGLLSLCAVLPTSILTGVRLSNDPLSLFFLTAAWSLLFHWWLTSERKSRYRFWTAFSFLTALSIDTKLTGLVLLPAALVCLLVRRFLLRTINKEELMLKTTALLFIILAICSPLLYQRFFANEKITIGVNRPINHRLSIPNTVSEYVTFRPFTMLEHPYANTWSVDALRKNFPEFLFRSAFFGEFNFGESSKPFASLTLAVAMGVLVTTLCLFISKFRDLFWLHFSNLVLISGFALSVFWYRLTAPFSCCQDFRFMGMTVAPYLSILVSIQSFRVLRTFIWLLTGSIACFWLTFIITST